MGPFKNGWTESDVEEVLARGDPEELLYIPILVGMNSYCVDRAWAENLCVSLAAHEHFQVRSNAATGLGHIARICSELTAEVVEPVMSKLLVDEDARVRAFAKDAACDIHRFAGVIVAGYDPAYTEEYLLSLVKAMDLAKKRFDDQH